MGRSRLGVPPVPVGARHGEHLECRGATPPPDRVRRPHPYRRRSHQPPPVPSSPGPGWRQRGGVSAEGTTAGGPEPTGRREASHCPPPKPAMLRPPRGATARGRRALSRSVPRPHPAPTGWSGDAWAVPHTSQGWWQVHRTASGTSPLGCLATSKAPRHEVHDLRGGPACLSGCRRLSGCRGTNWVAA